MPKNEVSWTHIIWCQREFWHLHPDVLQFFLGQFQPASYQAPERWCHSHCCQLCLHSDAGLSHPASQELDHCWTHPPPPPKHSCVSWASCWCGPHQSHPERKWREDLQHDLRKGGRKRMPYDQYWYDIKKSVWKQSCNYWFAINNRT